MSAARIAIVDDDQQFVEYLGTFLRSRGYDSVAHRSGASLLQSLSTGAPPDAVLLDVLMPNPDGLETLQSLRAGHPDLPVIMVSGRQVPSTIVGAVRLGALDYVLKPTDAAGVEDAALEAAIRRAIECIALRRDVARLSAHWPDDPAGTQPWWSTGTAMREVATTVDRVADSDVSVLLSGESGVGKEVVARELHRRSSRRTGPFVKVNCAALPAELLESELFGHELGAFTGARTARVGKFAFAHEGTILLDEIGELPLALQAKLLHVIEDRAFTRLGSNDVVRTDARVLAATNRDLPAMLQARQFRDDLYYRLQVIEIRVPPLRQRRDEIPALVEFFLRRYAERYGRRVVPPSASLWHAILAYSWPGNIRELENAMKRFVILQDEVRLLADLRRDAAATTAPAAAPDPTPPAPAPPPDAIHDAAAPPSPAPPSADPPQHLPDLAHSAAMSAEREAILRALDHFRWNRRKAARHLGVSYKTLLNKMKRCGISDAQETPRHA